MLRKVLLLLILAALAVGAAGCTKRPPVPKVAVRLTLTVDSLLQNYAQEYDLVTRVPGTPQQIAETYMERYQPGPLPRVFEHSVIKDRYGTVLAEWIDEGRRTWVKEHTGQDRLPVIEFEDGTVYRAESKDMAARIDAGNLGTTA